MRMSKLPFDKLLSQTILTGLLHTARGRFSIDWRIHGVPEALLILRQGTVGSEQIGSITEVAWRGTLQPTIKRLRQ